MPTKPRKHEINQMGSLVKIGCPDEEIQTLRLAVEQSFHGINIADLEGIIIYANPASEAMYGYRKGQLAGKHVGIFNAEPKMSRTQIIPSIKSNGSWSGELIQKRKDGSHFPAHLSASIVVNDNEPIGMLGIVKDITERKLVEEALRESRERIERSQQVAHLGSWEFEIASQKLIWSDEVYRIFGYQPQEFSPTYEAFLEHVHPEDRARIDAVYKRSLQENLDSYEMEHRILRQASGEIRFVHEKCDHLRDADGRIVRSLGIIHDISERKQAEQALKRLNESLEEQVAERTALAEARTRQLQALSVELIEAEERERQRISHLLHENLQQVLAAAKFHLQEICETLPHSTELMDVVQMLSESIAISRNLSQELTPAILHQTDLAKSLEWLSRHMGEQFGLDVRIDAEAVHPLEKSSLQMFVFRAVQELLFNVVKHAGVKSARVALSYTDDDIIIHVSDEGRGFNPDILNSSPEKAGLGLLSLRERASYIGGSFKIESVLGRGSRFTLLLPLGFSTKDPLPENKEPQPDPEVEVIKNAKAGYQCSF